MSNPIRRVLASLRLVAGIPTDDFAGMTLPEYLFKQAREHTVAPDPENLQGFMATPGGMATQMLVMIFAEALAKTPAPNYLTIEGEAESTGPIEIIIRRRDGKTPAQVVTEMRGQRDLLLNRLRTLADRMEVFIESDMADEDDQEAYDAARFAEAMCSGVEDASIDRDHLIALLVRAEFELTHSERHGDVDLGLLPALRDAIAKHRAVGGAS